MGSGQFLGWRASMDAEADAERSESSAKIEEGFLTSQTPFGMTDHCRE